MINLDQGAQQFEASKLAMLSMILPYSIISYVKPLNHRTSKRIIDFNHIISIISKISTLFNSSELFINDLTNQLTILNEYSHSQNTDIEKFKFINVANEIPSIVYRISSAVATPDQMNDKTTRLAFQYLNRNVHFSDPLDQKFDLAKSIIIVNEFIKHMETTSLNDLKLNSNTIYKSDIFDSEINLRIHQNYGFVHLQDDAMSIYIMIRHDETCQSKTHSIESNTIKGLDNLSIPINVCHNSSEPLEVTHTEVYRTRHRIEDTHVITIIPRINSFNNQTTKLQLSIPIPNVTLPNSNFKMLKNYFLSNRQNFIKLNTKQKCQVDVIYRNTHISKERLAQLNNLKSTSKQLDRFLFKHSQPFHKIENLFSTYGYNHSQIYP
jgi:hypothetical protein